MTTTGRYLIGLGNYSKDDDGIGLRIVEHITEQNLDQGFEAVEIGNDGMSVLTYFNDATEKLVIVDCAKMDREPGDFVVFGPEDVDTRKITGNVSTHEGDILKLIEFGKSLGYPIPTIRIVAVEPASLDLNMKLSPTLEARFSAYVEAAIAEVLA